MAEEKQVLLPGNLVKNLFTLLMLAAVILYVAWTAVLVVKHGVFFDLGLYSICIVMFLFGLTGRFLFSESSDADAQ